jgi:hypothetical protein
MSTAMRARMALIATAAVPLGAATAVMAASAATKLTPAEIQATFFNGEVFNAATPGGVKFKMTFTADGKAKRAPAGKGGVKSDGEWKLDDAGYCTTWKGGKANCFTVLPNGQNKWQVMQGPVVVAIWSK